MKRILLSSACFLSLTCLAQNRRTTSSVVVVPPGTRVGLMADYQPWKKTDGRTDSMPSSAMVSTIADPSGLMQYRFTLPNGNKIFQLSQDHMPCVVPGGLVYNMPGAKPPVPYKKDGIAPIPNPALPVLPAPEQKK